MACLIWKRPETKCLTSSNKLDGVEYPAGRLTETSRFNRMCPVAGCPGCPVGRLAGWPVEPGNRETGSAGQPGNRRLSRPTGQPGNRATAG